MKKNKYVKIGRLFKNAKLIHIYLLTQAKNLGHFFICSHVLR